MGQERDTLSREHFIKLLRSDLNHLYDADHLRQSPLLEWFGLSSRFDAPFALQNALIAAIEDLRPGKSDPAAGQYRRFYEVLHIRYVQQGSQDEVATQFGVSIRQVRREQQAALELLGARLWNKFHLDSGKRSESGPPNRPEEPHSELDKDREPDWLKEDEAENIADLSRLLPQVIELLEPFAQKTGVILHADPQMAQPPLRVRRVVLRQALITLVTLAIEVAADDTVEIGAQITGSLLSIRITCRIESAAVSRINEQQASVGMVQRMIEIFGGQLVLETAQAQFEARLELPIVEPISVLVIDDNPDFFQLMQRFTENTRYQLTSLQDPTLALPTARKLQPAMIVLDVMMPHIDGWQVLRDLKQDEETVHIVVIVCTVFTQKDLAYTLGADDFAQKPITQASLLAALDRQAERMMKTGRQSSAPPSSNR